MAKHDFEASTSFLEPAKDGGFCWYLQTRWKESRIGRKLETLSRRTSTWHFIVRSGLAIALFVFVLNVAFLIWSVVSTEGDNVLYRGDCEAAKEKVTGASLVINILSTLLLGASNAAMQCLCAPTRAEVDKVHAEGRWLDIGTSALGNWRIMARWRRYAWVCLLVSTVPLHLLYNSVIFSTSQANKYMALLVTPAFLDNAAPTRAQYSTWVPAFGHGYNMLSEYPTLDHAMELAEPMLKNISGLTRLENEECIHAYGTDFVSNFQNVFLISDDSHDPSADSIIAGNIASIFYDHTWICGRLGDCNIPAMIDDASSWSFTTNSSRQTYDVSYCLAQPVEPQCMVSALPPVLAVVIVCNILKVISFATLLRKRNFTPLMVLGDAIASFMSYPDPNAALTRGPMSTETVRKAYLADPLRFSTQRQRGWQRADNQTAVRAMPWHPARRFWASAIGPKRWTLTLLGFAVLWGVGVYWLHYEQTQQTNSVSFSEFWAQGFGTLYPTARVGLSTDVPVIGLVVLANLPQLLLSFVYLMYNDSVTCMIMSTEFHRYAQDYKGLRTTLPEGEQRSTYRLSLPFKVSIPLMIASGALHWAMSQTLFFAKVRVFSPKHKLNPTASFNTLGWSALALLILLLVGGLMLVALILCGFQRFGRGAPTIGSNSRCMLAASRTLGYGRDEALKRVRYGVLPGYDGRDGRLQRVGFASEGVRSLEGDEVYG